MTKTPERPPDGENARTHDIGRLSAFKSVFIWSALLAVLMAIGAYLTVRLFLFFLADYPWYEKFAAFFLLGAEIFIMLHGFGYFLNVLRVLRSKEQKPVEPLPALSSFPWVAIVVSSYKEPLPILRDTLTCFYNLTYPRKRIYFLDDTRYGLPAWEPQAAETYRDQVDRLCKKLGVNLCRRHWRGAKAGMINDFLAFLDGHPPEGFRCQSFDGLGNPGQESYIVVFDADMNPLPDFVEPLLARMEANERLAFIQTPQYYTNFESNRVAMASGLQQAVFYEYICEGKSLKQAMFCCGTNVIIRREALRDVGGFDESSVTEDFATSLKFHIRNWQSAYLNGVTAFGLGPEDLGGYFRQQFRWSLGTVGMFRSVIGHFIRNPFKLSANKWWEYFLSCTHYFIGLILAITIICPALFLLFDIPSYYAKPEIYALFYSPYIILTLSLFGWSMSQRHYKLRDITTGVVLQAICFPVYIKASVLALLGVHGTFGVTPKGETPSLPLWTLWPQIGLAVLSFGAIVWGGLRLYYEGVPALALSVNMLWCSYHFLILSAILYFNHPLESPHYETSS